MGFCLPDGRRHDHALVEGGCGLRHGHGVIPVQRPVGTDALVVESVSQLVGKGHDIAESAVEIGQNAALADALHPGAERAAGLSVPGIEVDPFLVKGARHHVRQLGIEGGEQLHQNPFGVLRGVPRSRFAHGREQIVPWQAVFVAQRLSLGAEVLPEFRHVFFHRPQHGVQGLPLHVGLFQRPVKGRRIATELAVRNGLQLDGVQGEGHGVPDPVVTAQLCFVGRFPHGWVGVIGQIADGGQIGRPAVVAHRHGAGQIFLQVAPRAGAGHGQLGADLLSKAAQQVGAVSQQAFKQEGVVLQRLVPGHQYH